MKALIDQPGIRWLLYCACGLGGSLAAEAISAEAPEELVALSGYPCTPCTVEDVFRYGIVLPPREVRPACDAYDNDTTGIYALVRRPANCRR